MSRESDPTRAHGPASQSSAGAGQVEPDGGESFFATLLEHHPDGVVVLDRAGRFKHINPGLGKMVGRPLKAPTTMEELAEILVPDPEHRAEAFRTWAEDLALDNPPAHVLAFQHSSGELRWGRFQHAHLPNGDILISCVEFTDQKRLEQEALESRELYRALVMALPDAVTVTDLEGRITHVSQRALGSYGYAHAEEMIGKSVFDLVAPNSRHLADALRDALLATGQARTEGEVQRKDGSRFHADVSASLVRGSRGEPVAFIGVTRDITERRQAEQALRESEERYRTLFENAPVGLGLTDQETGKVLACNDAIVQASGRTREEVLKLNSVVDLFFDPADRDALLARAREQGGFRQVETKLRRKDGSSYNALVSLASVRVQGRPCWQSVVEDVDERRRVMLELEARNAELARANEELARLHRAKDEFVATISHELRTPLVTGIGYIDLLLDGSFGKLSPRAQSRMRVALRNLKRLSRLIDDLLHYNRVAESTRYAPARETVDLPAVIGECATEFVTRTKRKKTSVSTDVAGKLPSVLADRELLRTVFANLLDNADRHGGERARIRISAREEAGRVKISISDDGEGMAPEVRERAFEPFYRGKGGQGLGLGLFIVRRILEAHGSEVRVESAPGAGTTFLFSLASAGSARADDPPRGEGTR